MTYQNHTHLPHTAEERRRMLETIGVSSVEELFQVIPETLRSEELPLRSGLSEMETRVQIERLAANNRVWGGSGFLGAGCYNHYIPSAVRSLASRSEFTTAYTPYQAEVSQGTLRHIFEFQTVITQLTELEVANASLYDGASAAAEAAFLALRQTGRNHIVLSAGLHPETIQTVETYASGPGAGVERIPLDRETGRTTTLTSNSGTLEEAGVLIIQQPNFFGVIEDIASHARAAHEAGALLVVVQNPITLGVLSPPGAEGADIAVGDLQPFGNPASFGGPSAGYLACHQDLLRQLPGRLVGETLDADGRRCYTLTLQAREQHIRRSRATSNICSNQALNALTATIYLALLGPEALHRVGEICLRRAHHLCVALASIPDIERLYSAPFFHEFALTVRGGAGNFVERMREKGIDPGVHLRRFYPGSEETILVAVTEVNTPADLARYVEAASQVMPALRSKEPAERTR